ncbi:serine/threonine protein kinase [Capronia epimyces CBS 606.96]|uniref:Serine/threonine protein kinase n=1 Tax=Capronia epimyces CBS 606.96 TaxID=1182542 RepID=W9XPT1_9EURO|nr:serine/threonine protein kinase [Capronia epimyces CBS 606.96]EXJ82238.1 serine/threonine protein kinase [Capronia epimyces CBS 606.96]
MMIGNGLEILSHTRVTKVSYSTPAPQREEFQSFVQLIEFEKLKDQLLDDTVTAIELRLESSEAEVSNILPRDFLLGTTAPDGHTNRYLDHACRISIIIHEDSSRILYPPYTDDDSWPPKILLSEIQTQDHITSSAILVQVLDNTRASYIYKPIERPFYEQSDTTVILQELENLKQCRGRPYIAQLFAVIVSTNPFQTRTCANNQQVIRGFLLEYYSGGTLERCLQEKSWTDLPWRQWPVQIGHGLQTLHCRGITHMDLKPSNIVLDDHGIAVIIDISGIGGVTWNWLAPELRERVGADAHFTFEEGRGGDIWAYGKLLVEIAKSVGRIEGVQRMFDIGTDIINQSPQSRTSLPELIWSLQSEEQEHFLVEKRRRWKTEQGRLKYGLSSRTSHQINSVSCSSSLAKQAAGSPVVSCERKKSRRTIISALRALSLTTHAAGEALFFGIDSLEISFLREAGVIFALYAVGTIIFAYLALSQIEDTMYFKEDHVVVPLEVIESKLMPQDNVIEGSDPISSPIEVDGVNTGRSKAGVSGQVSPAKLEN